MSIDVVCGQDVSENQALALGLVSEFDGRTYYFCSQECKRQFDAEPQRALQGSDRTEVYPIHVLRKPHL